jgi:cytochrome c5
MGDHDDKVFMKRFSGIIAGLVIVTILIIIIAAFNKSDPDPEDNPSRVAMAEQRVAPVGAVRTELPVAVETVEEVVEIAPAGADQPATGGIDGAAIYAQVCQACHVSGAAGAPIPGSEAWADRAEKGLDILTASAINGIGMMPPKGGRMDISDAEIRAAVENMLAQ